MSGYLLNFSVYTAAMLGVIFLALFSFKAFSNKCFSKKSSMLNIEDSMNLSPRKTLHVINVQNERYLIAADADRTSLIAKLDCKSEIKGSTDAVSQPTREDKSLQLSCFDGIDSLEEFSSVIDFKKEKAAKGPMMRELARKLSVI